MRQTLVGTTRSSWVAARMSIASADVSVNATRINGSTPPRYVRAVQRAPTIQTHHAPDIRIGRYARQPLLAAFNVAPTGNLGVLCAGSLFSTPVAFGVTAKVSVHDWLGASTASSLHVLDTRVTCPLELVKVSVHVATPADRAEMLELLTWMGPLLGRALTN